MRNRTLNHGKSRVQTHSICCYLQFYHACMIQVQFQQKVHLKIALQFTWPFTWYLGILPTAWRGRTKGTVLARGPPILLPVWYFNWVPAHHLRRKCTCKRRLWWQSGHGRPEDTHVWYEYIKLAVNLLLSKQYSSYLLCCINGLNSML